MTYNHHPIRNWNVTLSSREVPSLLLSHLRVSIPSPSFQACITITIHYIVILALSILEVLYKWKNTMDMPISSFFAQQYACEIIILSYVAAVGSFPLLSEKYHCLENTQFRYLLYKDIGFWYCGLTTFLEYVFWFIHIHSFTLSQICILGQIFSHCMSCIQLWWVLPWQFSILFLTV